ncbi:unnamed protein product [Symbiodinium natans]|uniref:Reticulocyte-binding protein 2-like a n=1 Tax=Symbiodinium natans TaxID=878477 RepID=A0A812PA39_9DINO|nr:unnamed protein product [Symbiodinium natans]
MVLWLAVLLVVVALGGPPVPVDESSGDESAAGEQEVDGYLLWWLHRLASDDPPLMTEVDVQSPPEVDIQSPPMAEGDMQYSSSDNSEASSSTLAENQVAASVQQAREAARLEHLQAQARSKQLEEDERRLKDEESRRQADAARQQRRTLDRRHREAEQAETRRQKDQQRLTKQAEEQARQQEAARAEADCMIQQAHREGTELPTLIRLSLSTNELLESSRDMYMVLHRCLSQMEENNERTAANLQNALTVSLDRLAQLVGSQLASTLPSRGAVAGWADKEGDELNRLRRVLSSDRSWGLGSAAPSSFFAHPRRGVRLPPFTSSAF